MSRTAQGVIAVKQCRFPPVFGYKIEVSHGAVTTLSTANFASLTVIQPIFTPNFKYQAKMKILWYMHVKHRLANMKLIHQFLFPQIKYELVIIFSKLTVTLWSKTELAGKASNMSCPILVTCICFNLITVLHKCTLIDCSKMHLIHMQPNMNKLFCNVLNRLNSAVFKFWGI